MKAITNATGFSITIACTKCKLKAQFLEDRKTHVCPKDKDKCKLEETDESKQARGVSHG